MSKLAQLQLDFQNYVLGADSPIAASVQDQFGLAASERLAIYQNAYRIRMREALAEAYDKTWSFVGDEMFAELAASYLAKYPSAHRNLRWFGSEFAEHAATELPDYAFIAELAQFEWTLGLAFDAADLAPLNADSMRSVAPEDWAGQVFALHPSASLLNFEWNMVAVWQALVADAAPPDPEQGAAQTWLIWRFKEQPHFRSLDAQEAAALSAIVGGASFGDICAEGEELRVAGYLQSWLAHGLLLKR